MPAFPQSPQMPVEPRGTSTADLWGVLFQRAFQRLWTTVTYVLNALCKVDTLANRPTTPVLNEILFVTSDTDQAFIGVAGAWKEIGRISGTSGGAIPFTEITAPAAPAANAARLYAVDNGAGKTLLVVRFGSGSAQTIATEP